MKLKKIASLMLAGIMAVSMLAGCNGGTTPNDDSSSSETPATGVSATFAGYLKNGDRVDFNDNNVYQNYLASAIEKRDLNYSVLGEVDEVEAITSGELYKNVQKLFNDGVIGYKDKCIIDNLGAIKDTTDTTFTTLYQAPGSMEEDVVLKAVAGKLDAKFDKNILVNFYTNNDNTYDYDYTGSVSMQKVEDGSASAWFVLVTLSVDVAKTGK